MLIMLMLIRLIGLIDDHVDADHENGVDADHDIEVGVGVDVDFDADHDIEVGVGADVDVDAAQVDRGESFTGS